MEKYIYIIVKLLCATYILCKLWKKLFGERAIFFWSTPKAKCFIPSEELTHSPAQVVGKTKIDYLPEQLPYGKEPVMSQELKPSGYIGTEEVISSEEVEAELTTIPSNAIPTEDELFESIDDNVGLDADFSTGLTYEKLSNAVSVLMEKNLDEDLPVIEAAQTIFSVRHTDLFQFFTTQVSNSEMVANLLRDCLDESGAPLPYRKSKKKLDAFSWEMYV